MHTYGVDDRELCQKQDDMVTDGGPTPARVGSKVGNERARLIALIGNDGAGKSTQAARLAEWLNNSGHVATVNANESLSPMRTALERLALEDGEEDPERVFGRELCQMMYVAIKWHALVKIEQHLQRSNTFVIADRYAYCHVASVRSQGLTTAGLVERLFASLPQPDLTLWLKVSPETALARIHGRGDVSRAMSWDYLEGHARAYEAIEQSGLFTAIDAEQNPDAVAHEIQAAVTTTFGL